MGSDTHFNLAQRENSSYCWRLGSKLKAERARLENRVGILQAERLRALTRVNSLKIHLGPCSSMVVLSASKHNGSQ